MRLMHLHDLDQDTFLACTLVLYLLPCVRCFGPQNACMCKHAHMLCRLERVRTARAELAAANVHVEAALAALSPAVQSIGPQAGVVRQRMDACYTTLRQVLHTVMKHVCHPLLSMDSHHVGSVCTTS